ncbi:MAG: TIGR00730 family Rossman fold protein [Polyangiaceae bacterium]
MLKRITVYCGSRPGRGPEYLAAATAFGQEVARRGLALVYGGARVGLMGAVADAALEAGGHVIGVIPETLVTKELAHERLSELHVVPGMHVRKTKLFELADAIVALPGGAGTMDEWFEMLTWSQIGLHAKPLGLLNVRGYYDGLLSFLEHMESEGFAAKEHRGLYLADATAGGLLDALDAFSPPAFGDPKDDRRAPGPPR